MIIIIETKIVSKQNLFSWPVNDIETVKFNFCNSCCFDLNATLFTTSYQRILKILETKNQWLITITAKYRVYQLNV